MNKEKYPRVSTCNPSVFSSMGKDAASNALSALSRAAMMTIRSIGSLHIAPDEVFVMEEEMIVVDVFYQIIIVGFRRGGH